MIDEIEVLSGDVEQVSIRRLNHGFPDTLVITRPDGSRFAFQSAIRQLDGDEEVGALHMTRIQELFKGEEVISAPAFEQLRSVKSIYLKDDPSGKPVGYVIHSDSCLPIIIAPGSVFGSLSVLGLETRGRENGLELYPSDYVVQSSGDSILI